jgi:EAL domain-containing protein (putative c-di-GMP-specific phosphodiesterase class I)
VAAFVETEGLLNGARDAGFKCGQGFRFAEPSADLSALIALVNERRR